VLARWDGLYASGAPLRSAIAYWGLGIGAPIAAVFVVGAGAGHAALRGGPIIGWSGDAVTAFFALPGLRRSGLLIGSSARHVLLVLKLGVNEWPMPGPPASFNRPRSFSK